MRQAPTRAAKHPRGRLAASGKATVARFAGLVAARGRELALTGSSTARSACTHATPHPRLPSHPRLRFAELLATAFILAAALALLAAAPASAAFGLKDLDANFQDANGAASLKAGTHPFAFVTDLAVNVNEGTGDPEGEVKDLIISAPPGLVGTPTPGPRCAGADFLVQDGCSDSTVLGHAEVAVADVEEDVPVYNLIPPPGVAAKLGFIVLGVPVTVQATVNPNPPYNLIATSPNTLSQVIPFFSARVHLWGVPADPAHDGERGSCIDNDELCPAGVPPKPFLTLPTRCTEPLATTFRADSWEDPGTYFEQTVTTHDDALPPNPLAPSGCAGLNLFATIDSQPTSAAAASSSGLDFTLAIEDKGLTEAGGTAQSTIEKAVVTLPAGVTANPSLAAGLGTCSQAELASESLTAGPGQGCPQAAKIGAVEVETPLLEGELLRGSVYVATPNANPFGTLIALYMVIRDEDLGILLKLPGKVEPDPATGQLVTTFDDLPQIPFSEFRFRFRQGTRAPLITPPTCGSFETKASFTPYSGRPPVPASASFEITSGPGGAPCPLGTPPFAPGFDAGSLNNAAGHHSPFSMRITRADGEQGLTRFSALLPPGLTGKIAGVARCGEAAIAAARQKSGLAEILSPSCPAAAQIGTTSAGAGVGSELTYVPGSLYLAGPHGGAPLSVVAITPAVAGPFDVGTVVVREALDLDPDSAQVIVDGAASDPIPHILAGIPLALRDLRVEVNRPGFTLNPTSCEPKTVNATLFGSAANPLDPADDAPVAASERYQAASCASLGFAPKLALRLKGKTRRGANASLRATLTTRPEDANLKGAVITLPPSQFIDNAHINNPCTRDQYAAGACPARSRLGYARAYTPLLDEPLQGPVYFRSNGGVRDLPDVVADLGGQFDFDLVIAVLTSTNERVRTKVLNAPDAPVSKFTLRMAGGRKGLLENSSNLCRSPQRANLNLIGQNGRRLKVRQPLATDCKKAKKRGKGAKGAKRRR